MAGTIPYVILIGNVGAGKSTLVEKVSGATGMSSAASTRVTKTADVFLSVDGSLMICDTPGTNSTTDQLSSNIEIARALNFMPVNLVLITVKAHVRMESVAKGFREYMEYFLPEDFPLELIGFCITHMDTVIWVENELIHYLKSDLGIENVICSFPEKKSRTLIQEIKDECLKNQPVSIDIDSEIFLRLFKINNNEIKILRETRKEVARFEKIKKDFYVQLKCYNEIEQKEMIFEFQAWMSDQIVESQRNLSCNNNFSFTGGPGIANEAGHIANLTNQLRQVLRNVRIEAMKYHVDVQTDFRKCPYCGKIWQKVEGCEGDTQCGKTPSEKLKLGQDNGEKLTNDVFSWNEIVQELDTKKNSRFIRENVRNSSSVAATQKGCGQTINWSKMAPVKVPGEFYTADHISTKDVKPIPEEHRRAWENHFDKVSKQKGKLQIKKAEGFQSDFYTADHSSTKDVKPILEEHTVAWENYFAKI